jgi:hypothetical protein
MEMSQGNSLHSYLKQAKMSFFFLFLLQNWRKEGRTGPAWGGGGCLILVAGGGERV